MQIRKRQRPDNAASVVLSISRCFAHRRKTLREGEQVRSSPHPPRSGPPSPQGEGLNAAFNGARLTMSGVHGYRRPHPPRSGHPSLRGEGLNAAPRGDCQFRGRRSSSRARRAERCRAAGGAKPIAGRGGWEGCTPPHNSRRGQRLPTDKRHSPAPREAQGSGLR